MTPNQLLCFGCMHELTTPGEVCPHCGHDNHIRHNGPGLLGETLLGGQYQVGRVLGRGGFGVTYIGYDLNLTQCIAIKEYFPTSLVTRSKDDLTLTAISGSEASYENGLQRALKEGRMAASLRRIPGVVQVYNVLPANNTMYIIMEYVEGRTLTDYVENSPAPLTPAQAQKLLAPVADALTRLHKMDVIHRDVKPDNIMIRREDDEGVLLDFGAARSVDARTHRNSSAIVSAGYAPVEQYNLSSLDGRIDQYALAATLMFTLSGKAPPDVMQRLAMPESTPVLHALNPAVSPAVEQAVLRGMALKADDRYPDVDTFWQAFCNGETAAEDKAKGNDGKGVGIAIAAAVGVVLLGCVLYFTHPGSDPAQGPAATGSDRADRELSILHGTPAPTTPASAFKYARQKDGTIHIEKYRGSDGHVVVPSEIGGMPVTVIGKEAFCYNSTLETVILPEGLTAINEYAFYGCKSLTDIHIPEGVTTIGHYAFHSCESLRGITIPKSVAFIGNSSFYGCKSLTGIVLPEGITAVGDYAFHSCGQLEEAVIPEGVTSIGYYAFFGCSALKGLTLPRSLTAIDNYAFYGCESLRELAIPAGVAAIGKQTFAFCEGLALTVTEGSYAQRFAKANGLNYTMD